MFDSKKFVIGSDGGLYDARTGEQILTPKEVKASQIATLGLGATLAFGLGVLTHSIFGD